VRSEGRCPGRSNFGTRTPKSQSARIPRKFARSTWASGMNSGRNQNFGVGSEDLSVGDRIAASLRLLGLCHKKSFIRCRWATGAHFYVGGPLRFVGSAADRGFAQGHRVPGSESMALDEPLGGLDHRERLQ